MVEGGKDRERLRMELGGAVQGVGFRPFVYRLATRLGLSGWVLNGTSGVVLEVEGPRLLLEDFRRGVLDEKPPHSRVDSITESWLAACGSRSFEIRFSDPGGERSVSVLPDLATCAECLGEVRDPADRRHRYPFANCTLCGPRFTIVRSLPYDRPSTTMAGFALCAACKKEYEEPLDRRFHAQPIACPECGPSLTFWTTSGEAVATREAALSRAASLLREGGVVGVKGLGGFHLMCDAQSDASVDVLRARKGRFEKPFALMVASSANAAQLVDLQDGDDRILTGSEAPILLARARAGSGISTRVAPENPLLGVMLPPTPLHHLLLEEAGIPLVATSGNRSEEPIAIDEKDAFQRLGDLCDGFLVHDRPIERHADDSVVRRYAGGIRVLRRARGYAPLPVRLASALPAILAVGGHLKNTVALSVEKGVFISQHIGDLETPEARLAFQRVIADFLRLYEAQPVAVAHDLHPGYVSTVFAGQLARERGIPAVAVQHHHAHLASCLAENGFSGRALGVTWDGTGYGLDETVWGGEFLLGDASSFERVAHLAPFRLPGGEAAIREPRRAVLALLFECLGREGMDARHGLPAEMFTDAELRVLCRMLETSFQSPVTTSAGRLFDGVAALLGLFPARASFEGQAAMALEWLAERGSEDGVYPMPLDVRTDQPAILDWRPMLLALIDDLKAGVARETLAARFHQSLAEGIVAVARLAAEGTVALSGGCFQNALLTELCVRRLSEAGFRVLLHQQVPPGDGGISLGQAAVAGARQPQLARQP
ncbi:MAG: carbamoyltransferase HypF [Acidobacteria bacterium]|nr:carbamoyltransferase HypF [Acidobacteriota bacterium]